jgi:hypothetical protein
MCAMTCSTVIAVVSSFTTTSGSSAAKAVVE